MVVMDSPCAEDIGDQRAILRHTGRRRPVAELATSHKAASTVHQVVTIDTAPTYVSLPDDGMGARL